MVKCRVSNQIPTARVLCANSRIQRRDAGVRRRDSIFGTGHSPTQRIERRLLRLFSHSFICGINAAVQLGDCIILRADTGFSLIDAT